MTNDSPPILIKRYASRRLYNTNTSDYVTLDEVAQFIRDGRDVQIVDRKTGADLTRQYMLQIIIDYETRGENVLPINVLTDLVRSYSDQAQNIIPDFLSQSYDMLKKQQSLMLNVLPPQVKDTLPQIDGLEQWQKMQSEFLSTVMSPWTGGKPPAESETEVTPSPASSSSEPENVSKENLADETKAPKSKPGAKPSRKSATGAKKKASASSKRPATKRQTSKSQTTKTTAAKSDAKEKEIDEIRQQLVELQSKLKDL